MSEKITITQAAAKFNISKSTLVDLILKGRIDAEMRSGVWYLSKENLSKYQQKQKTAKAAAKLLKMPYYSVLHKVKLGIIKGVWSEKNQDWLISKKELDTYVASNKKPPTIPPTWHYVGDQINYQTKLPTGLKQFVCCGCGGYQYFSDLATAKQNPCCLVQIKKYWQQENFSQV
jgi:hypothetical protein